MSKTVEEPDDDAGGASSDSKTPDRCIYFDTASLLTDLLAGDVPGNLKTASGRLGVQLVSRDNWVRIIADTPDRLMMAETFFRTLSELYKTTGMPLLQGDFTRI